MNKIRVTQQQRDNAHEALNVMWPSVPPQNVIKDLGAWREKPDKPLDCGAAACFGGWCAVWPPFVAQGVTKGEFSGMPLAPGGAYLEAAEFLFGHDRMFYARRLSAVEHIDKSFSGGTDHELITHRLKWLIENSEVIS